MADWTPEDLSREIDRLWARLGSASAEPPAGSFVPVTAPAGALAGAEAAWETVALLKRQQRQREATWQQAVEAKDEALRVLRARCAALETEVSRLRERVEGEDERVLLDALDTRGKVEAAQKAIEQAQARHDEERRALEEALQSLRERLAAETANARAAERRWQAREQQQMIDLKELQALVQRREAEAAGADQAARARQDSLAEAKSALEKTLAELLLERRERERAHEEREAALKKAEELRAHVDELSRIWEEERSQWRELWDRERSTWETQRAELAQWEENLRREREAWHAELQAKEKAHVELSESLAGKLRETSLTAERMSGMIAAFEGAAPTKIVQSMGRVRWALLFGGLAAAAAICVPVWRWASAWSYRLESVSPVPTASPVSLALDGRLLWVADWGGALSGVDPRDPRQVARRAAPAPGGPYRPTALAFGSGMFWTLDAAQGRLVRHSAEDPEKILSTRPSPGPAPTALAYDGETVWSYDAVNHALTRHGGDDSPAQSYVLPGDAVPDAMAWVDGRLWAHDAKSRRILVYALSSGTLVLSSSQAAPDPDMIGLAVAGSAKERRIYALLKASGTRSQPELARYRLKRRIPFAHF